MRVGDKILCKESFLHATLNWYYIKGKTYEILDITNNNGICILTTSCEIEGKKYRIYSKDGGWNPGWTTLFEYHFYTDKELRKLKLERLSNV